MLLKGSIRFHILLVLVVVANGQHYESEYGVVDDEGEDHASYNEDSGHPDYSKYYSSDNSAPLAPLQSEANENPSSGFVTPLDFSSFFGPSNFEFGASNNKEVQNLQNPKSPFLQEDKNQGFVSSQDFQSDIPNFAAGSSYGPADYYEKAQKKQKDREDDYESNPGPSYATHKTASEVDDLVEKLPKHKSPKYYQKSKPKESKKIVNNAYPLPNFKPGKLVNYNIGKSGSTVSQNPHAPEYYTKYLQPATLSPYQKYSFQPVPEAQGLKSAYSDLGILAPFNPAYSRISSSVAPSYDYQPSENIAKSIKKGHCKKLNKEINAKDIKTGRYKRQPMDCYVCEDPKTKAQSEQCSYSTPTKPENYYSAQAAQFAPIIDPIYYRQKRYSKDDSGEGYVDPYEYVKSQSQKYYSKPEAFDSDVYKPKDFPKLEEYSIPSEYYASSSNPEKSSSEAESEKLQKSGADCKTVEKDGMTCTVCNSKTGGNYEQCSYKSKPSEQKYAYVRERKFDGNEPVIDREVESTEPKEVRSEGKSSKSYDDDDHKKSSSKSEETHNPYESIYNEGKSDEGEKHEGSEEKETKSEPYSYSEHYAESNKKEKQAEDDDKKSDEYSIDEYHFKYFPEFSESKQDEKFLNPSHPPGSKQNVEEVLAEFAKKDRTECKKTHKKGMTCYACIDKKGMQHEECMYVSESKPKSTQVAYEESKDLKSPKKDITSAESKISTEKTLVKPKVESKKIDEVTAAASNEYETRVKYNPEKEAKSESAYNVGASSDNHESKEKYDAQKAAFSNSKSKLAKEKKKKKEKSSKKYNQKEQSVAETRDEEAAENEEQQQLEEEEESDKYKASPSDSEEPQKQTPEEFVVGEEEGAFSAETKPVFSKTLGVTLPKYMLQKSEFEEIFDEFASSG